jgi:hypothetical protein
LTYFSIIQVIVKMSAPTIPSQVDILKTDAAAKKGLGVKAKDTEAVWPKPQFVSVPSISCLSAR